ncbi:hypothetical protein [Pampinifervens florentissimum]|uniref:hypothetical protein n=1 Tax=Pampinifervens florentissimum TaxID=1632019 RepID=UPI0013B4825B|nr:hypothetical protein [Hydrogenobacter sp. T-8]QID32616.1 hypothetical protein G3M65_01995 [Hydrogenobacter sp. T-8]
MFELKGIKVGFFCSTADGKITTNRKFRLSNLSYQKVMDVLEKNLKDFERLLEISLYLGCGIFRLGSDLILEAKQKEKAVEKLLSELYIYLDAKP